jgi:hypothetical protein
MDLIWRDVPLEEIDAGLLTRFPDHGPDSFCHLTASPCMAVRGDPDVREVEGTRRRGARARVTHAPQSTQNLRKLPPQGGGFAPPKRRQ